MNLEELRRPGILRHWILIAALGIAAGCGSPSPTSSPTPDPPTDAARTPAPTSAAATPAPSTTTTTEAAPAAPSTPAGGEQAAVWPAEAPAQFKVRFELSNGVFVAEFHKDWAPIGVQHLYDLVRAKFFDEARFFRVVPNFVVQWGIAADPALDVQWAERKIPDEPVKQGNLRGTIAFGNTGRPNSRSAQLFVNLNDNSASLDRQNFPAIGQVIEGLDVVNKISSAYADLPEEQQPQQHLIHQAGNAYLNQNFPKLDYIKRATLER